MKHYPLIRKILFCFQPERVHDFTLNMLHRYPSLAPCYFGGQPVRLMGLSFPNRLGLAAGMDKNGIALEAWDRMGFGFVELGTVTPRPQAGNPKPRLFRLKENRAIINRMGFNNDGVEVLCEHIRDLHEETRTIVGISIGKNKDTPNEEALNDYIFCMQHAYPLADYLAINISSPNTQGLRDLQYADNLRNLLQGIKDARKQCVIAFEKTVPLLVKLAPDVDFDDLDKMLDIIAQVGMDGIIATNTTIERAGLKVEQNSIQEGGLSGAPLFARSTEVLQHIRKRLPDIPLIASGGVMDARTYQEKLAAGANLVQIFTGFIYQGPDLIRQCLESSPDILFTPTHEEVEAGLQSLLQVEERQQEGMRKTSLPEANPTNDEHSSDEVSTF